MPYLFPAFKKKKKISMYIYFAIYFLLCFYIFTETLEKLAKREKEVSTLTTQVDDLKTQITGNDYVLHADSFAAG